MISWEGVVLQTKVKPQTKGTVLLVCWKCTDILLFASKHAKGMSLRYDAILIGNDIQVIPVII